MGFLIFAYRKLFLKRKIDDIGYRQLVLSQKQQQMTEQVGVMQQAMAAGKNLLSVFSNGSLTNIQNDIMKQYYKDGKFIGSDDDKLKIQNEVMQKQYAVMATNSACNSIFEAANTAMMAPLNAEGTQISMEMANNESQLKLLNAELESVEKAEDTAAKQCTPKFGLA